MDPSDFTNSGGILSNCRLQRHQPLNFMYTIQSVARCALNPRNFFSTPCLISSYLCFSIDYKAVALFQNKFKTILLR